MKKLLVLLALATPLAAVADHFAFRSGLPKPAVISKEEGKYLIEQFRQYRYPGDFSFHFQLINTPKGATEKTYYGTMWCSWSSDGPVIRADLWPANQNKSDGVLKILSYSGPEGRVWKQENGGDVTELEAEDMLKPLWEHIVYTPFDLQLGFVYWPDYRYYGPSRAKGRPAHIFTMYAPEAFKADNPHVKDVHMAMDADFNVLLKAEVRGNNSKTLRSFKIQSFRKVQDEYVLRVVDVIDNQTRGKSRILLTGAAMHLQIDPQYFDPANLALEGPNIASNQYTAIN